jgi:hypothetical protein
MKNEQIAQELEDITAQLKVIRAKLIELDQGYITHWLDKLQLEVVARSIELW